MATHKNNCCCAICFSEGTNAWARPMPAPLPDQDLRDILTAIADRHISPPRTWCLAHGDGTCNLCTGTTATPIIIR